MTSKKKPEPPLIDERHDRLVETPGDKKTPVKTTSSRPMTT